MNEQRHPPYVSIEDHTETSQRRYVFELSDTSSSAMFRKLFFLVAFLALASHEVTARSFAPRRETAAAFAKSTLVPQEAESAVLPRGGAAPVAKKTELTLAQKFLAMSCATAFTSGALVIFNWDAATSLLPSLQGVTVDKHLQLMLGGSMLGWSVGKYTAIKGGTATTKEFCSLNCIPMLFIILSSQVAGSWDLPIWVVFGALYAYFGYIEK